MSADASPDRPAPARVEGHLYWVDWLRFLAALLVVIDHARMINWEKAPLAYQGAHPILLYFLLSVTQLGRHAVVLFFVLSGLLVGGKTLARIRAGTFDAAAYAADRISRVYVPLVPALLLNAAIVRGYNVPFYPLDFLGCLVGLQGVALGPWGVVMEKPTFNLPLWTLAYEVWFYVLAGCAGVLWTRGNAWVKRVAAGVGVFVALMILCLGLDVAYLICWLLGTCGFILRNRITRWRGPLAVVGALVAVIGVICYQICMFILPPPPDVYTIWLPSPDLSQVIVAMGSLLFVACVIQMRPATRALAGFERMGGRLAAFSYTLYLTHLPVLYLIGGSSQRMPPVVDGASVGRALWWVVQACVAAWVMYALFESRTLAVRRWLRARLPGGDGATVNGLGLREPSASLRA